MHAYIRISRFVYNIRISLCHMEIFITLFYIHMYTHVHVCVCIYIHVCMYLYKFPEKITFVLST